MIPFFVYTRYKCDFLNGVKCELNNLHLYLWKLKIAYG